MKLFTRTLALILPCALTAVAGPLQRQEVAADAKWLLHLDVDKLRSTSVGDFLLKEAADKLLAEPKAVMKREADFDLDLTKIRSATAYGDFTGTNNVLLLKTDLDVEKALDAVIARLTEEGQVESSAVGKKVEDGTVRYTLKDHAVVWVRPDKTVILSKSAEANSRAEAVLAKRLPGLASSSGFAAFPKAPKGFFFLGAAEGFNARKELNAEVGEDGPNNPKAKILKLTESGQVVLGEETDQIFLNLSLKAKSAEVSKQMQQVVQGMIALAALAQSGNEDIQQLADSAKVTTAGDIVSIHLNFPSDKALEMLNKHLERHAGPHEHRKVKPASAEDDKQ